VFVTADLDQAHLRLIANLWGIGRLLRCFVETGEDPHMLLGLDIFGERLLQAGGWDGDLRVKPDKGSPAESARNSSKTLRYAGAYGALPETICATIKKSEDKASGRLLYPDIEIREVLKMHRTWMRSEPEWQPAWLGEIMLWDKHGFLADPIMGRRCDFADEQHKRGRLRGTFDDFRLSLNDIINFRILAGEASYMHLCALDLLNAIPFEKWGPGTGLVAQIHDEFVVECPASEAEWVKGVVEECMCRRLFNWPVPMTAEAGQKARWADPVRPAGP